MRVLMTPQQYIPQLFRQLEPLASYLPGLERKLATSLYNGSFAMVFVALKSHRTRDQPELNPAH